MDLIQLATFLGSFIGIVLLAVTYFYMDKLEKIGCACAEHSHRKFVMYYPLVAILFIVFTMFVPPTALGKEGKMVFMIAHFLFTIATLVFFILAFFYVRYLKDKKCQCSEDLRREILYIWSILEIVILASTVLFYIIGAILASTFAVLMTGAKGVNSSYATVREATVNPIKAASKLPASLKKNLSAFKRR